MKSLFVSFIFIGVAYLSSFDILQKNIDKNEFNDYVRAFTHKSLPIRLDRPEVFYLSKIVSDSVTLNYEKSPYPEVKEKYRKFLPEELVENLSAKNFRSVYVLPECNGIIPTVVAEDYYKFGNQYMLKLFLIVYTKQGEIRNYIELGGYEIDMWEKFAIIYANKQIETKNYQYVNSPGDVIFNNEVLAYFEETQNIYKIDSSGYIVKVEEKKRKGYFKEKGRNGYIFVK